MVSFRSLLVLVFGIFITHIAVGQETRVVSGRIVDAETQKAIPHAEVFISNTTVGTISNENGEFSLKVPFLPCTLIADHVSYDSYVKNIGGSITNLEIKLKTKVVAINEVKVSGKSNRKKNLKYFYAHFVKQDKKNIEILNDTILYFKKEKNEFIAYTNEPLIIVDHKVGYRVKFTMTRFAVFKRESPNGPNINLSSGKGQFYTKISGHYFYEELKTNSLKEMLQYKKNRRLRYFGSERHFFKSVYSNNLRQQGFELEIFPANQNLDGLKQVKNYDTGYTGKSYMVDCDSLKITYKYGKSRYPHTYSLQGKIKQPHSEVSTIYRSNQIFTLRENGTSPNVGAVIVGPMGHSPANFLPQNYDPFY